MIYRNILIVKLSAIGDVIHALPVAHALKACYPQSCITWVVEKPAYDLLTNNPDIDEIIIFDKPKFKSLGGLLRHGAELARLLRSRKFDLAIDLQGLFKSGAIAWLSSAPERLVYCNTREGSHLLSKRVCGQYASGHVVDRYLDVARHLGCKVEQPVFNIQISDDEAQKATTIAAHAGLKLDQPYVVLAIGANWPNKCWPLLHFAKLADKLYSDNIIPVLVGGPKEKQAYEEIVGQTGIPPIDLVGKTTLKQLAYIIRKARAFLGGDTGPMHLAAALDIPVIALYGPTDTIRNGPYGSKHIALTVTSDCAGCWQRQCPKNVECLAHISVEAVYHAMKEALG